MANFQGFQAPKTGFVFTPNFSQNSNPQQRGGFTNKIPAPEKNTNIVNQFQTFNRNPSMPGFNLTQANNPKAIFTQRFPQKNPAFTERPQNTQKFYPQNIKPGQNASNTGNSSGFQPNFSRPKNQRSQGPSNTANFHSRPKMRIPESKNYRNYKIKDYEEENEEEDEDGDEDIEDEEDENEEEEEEEDEENNYEQDLAKQEMEIRKKALATFHRFSGKKNLEEKNTISSSIPTKGPKESPQAQSSKSMKYQEKQPPFNSSIDDPSKKSGFPYSKSIQEEKRSPQALKTIINVLKSPLQATIPKPQEARQRTIEKKESSQKYLMCALEESRSRQESHQLSIFEIKPGSNNEVNPDWTLKKYLRSSADREEDKRSAESLSYALKYLINNVIDVDSDGNPNNYNLPEEYDSHTFQHIYPFVFDRMRAIVKDWKMLKNNDNDECLEDHEIIARFLIMACVEGYILEDFNQNLNLKLIEDVLNCLIKGYENKREKKLDCPNQAEFIAYFIITKPDNMLHITTLLKSLSIDIIQAPVIQIALKIFQAFHSEDFVEFFKIMKHAPFLITCASYPLFHKVRTSSLLKMHKTSTKSILLCDFTEIFWFSDMDEALKYASELGLNIEQNMENQSLCVIKTVDISDKLNFQYACTPECIQEKKKQKTRKEITNQQEFVQIKSIKPIEILEGIKKVEKIVKVSNEEIKKEIIHEQKDIKKPDILHTPEKNNQIKKDKNSEENRLNFLMNLIEKQIDKNFINDIFTYILNENIQSILLPLIENEKKVSFRFPDDDKMIISIVKDSAEKKQLMASIRNYRKEKKIKAKKEDKAVILIKQILKLNRWKRYVTWKKFKRYVSNRKIIEAQAYKSQFSTEVLSDILAHDRYIGTKRPRTEETFPPEFNAKTIIDLFKENKITVYKIIIYSPSNHDLYKYTKKIMIPFQNDLVKNNIFLNFSNKCELGCDLVMFIGKFSEIPKLLIEFSQRVVFILEESDINERQIRSKINFSVSDKIKVICLPRFFEVTEYSFYDIIGYQICKAIQRYKIPYKELKKVNISNIVYLYEDYFEKIDLSTKEKLFSQDYKYINECVKCINCLTNRILLTLDQLYYHPPSIELLQRYKLQPNQYTSIKKHYLEAKNLFQRLLFKEIPVFEASSLRSKDLLTILYRYAASMISYFDKSSPGCAFDLLKALDELFCNSPIVINHKLNYIKGSWCEYFITILSIISQDIENLGFSIIWDIGLEFNNDSDIQNDLFHIDLEEINNLGISYFNDEVSEIIFTRELSIR